MKKLLAFLLILTMVASLFAACGDFTIKVEQNKETQDNQTTTPDVSEGAQASEDSQNQEEDKDVTEPESSGETRGETTGETEEENTEETTENVTEPAYTEADIIFNSRYDDITLRTGEAWYCYNGNIPLEKITWKSDDLSVATVKAGVITAVNAGVTKIHAIWGEFDVTITIRCVSAEGGLPGSGGNIGEG